MKKIMNIEQAADLLGQKHSNFIKHRKRSEARLRKLGCEFTTEGIGKKTIYTFTHISEEVKDMGLAKRMEKSFGFKARRPYICLSYFFFLTHEPTKAEYMSDREAAIEILGNENMRASITEARKDLEKAGYIKPLSETEYGYFLTEEGEEKSETPDEDDTNYAMAWHLFYEQLGLHAHEMAMFELMCAKEKDIQKESHPEIQEAAGSTAWQAMKKYYGTPVKIKRRVAVRDMSGNKLQ